MSPFKAFIGTHKSTNFVCKALSNVLISRGRHGSDVKDLLKFISGSCNESLADGKQHDSWEFLAALFDGLSASLTGEPDWLKQIEDLMAVKKSYESTCNQCSRPREVYSPGDQYSADFLHVIKYESFSTLGPFRTIKTNNF